MRFPLQKSAERRISVRGCARESAFVPNQDKGANLGVLNASQPKQDPVVNILIVDDDAVSRTVLASALKKRGHIVASASGGEQALEIFAKSQHRIVVSDLLMPGIDGLELCRRIRKANAPQYTYLILLTAIEGKAGYLEGMRAGADDFISKPLDTDLLEARLVVAERVLNLQSQVRQLAGLLPICSLCKKVRDDGNYWHQVEAYISHHTDARFTHSYCPDCFKKLLSEVEALEATASPVRA